MYKTSIIIFFLRNFKVDFVLRSNQGIYLFIYLLEILSDTGWFYLILTL